MRAQQLVEQALIRENFKVSPTASVQLQGTLNEAGASVTRETRSVSLNFHTGEHTESDKQGKAKQVEDCKWEERDVAYLVSKGKLVLNLTALDAKAQSALFTQLISPYYSQESMVAGPRQCGNQTYTVAAGQLQDRGAILAHLVDRAVAEAVRYAAGYDERREVLLAVDNELKPGNAQALGGNWLEALTAWTEAPIKPKETDKEAARQYNLGVAHEALAATSMRNESFDEATTHLNEAEKSYSQALGLDRDEKYFRDTLARLQRDRAVLEKEQEHQFLKQAEAASLAPAPPAEPAAPITVSIPLEGWPPGEAEAVHDFRVYVRLRLGAQKGDVSEAFKQKLVASAPDYGVKEGIAMQVVDSEAKRLLVLQQNMDKYREDFKDVASDGMVSPDERAMLLKRQKTLHLSDDQVKEVEAQFPVR